MPTLDKEIGAVFSLKVHQVQRLSGGSIARAVRLHCESGSYFAKIMDGSDGYATLEAEADGLQALRQTGALSIPEVLGLKKLAAGACLLMEYISPGSRTTQAMESLGRGLARLHLAPQEAFGWPTDNYIGSLPQANGVSADWSDFYALKRLAPLYTMAGNHGLLPRDEIPGEDTLLRRLQDRLPRITPSLLHGDLWGGNYLISENGDPCLIDPAVYRGHSEVDLAMSRLFGGFTETFYSAYRELIPETPGWEARTRLYQLYYLLVHLILFGKSYYPAVREHSREWFGG